MIHGPISWYLIRPFLYSSWSPAPFLLHTCLAAVASSTGAGPLPFCYMILAQWLAAGTGGCRKGGSAQGRHKNQPAVSQRAICSAHLLMNSGKSWAHAAPIHTQERHPHALWYITHVGAGMKGNWMFSCSKRGWVDAVELTLTKRTSVCTLAYFSPKANSPQTRHLIQSDLIR